MPLIKHKLPCPECGGSDPVSVDQDGAGYCFSCQTSFFNYEKSCNSPLEEKPTDIKTYRNNLMNDSEGEFVALTDRNISIDTAKKYGVKAVTNYKGEIIKHLYPYYINNEITGYKIREQNKIFAWKGTSQGVGLFGQQLFKAGGKYNYS
tara:strand:+ start:692 stop:1138 length:447 start_codon:yes stop_codon:yes gene_type:complete